MTLRASQSDEKEKTVFRKDQKVRILINMNGLPTIGYISTIDPQAFPDENTPYRVVNQTKTDCLGWFGEDEIEPIECIKGEDDATQYNRQIL